MDEIYIEHSKTVYRYLFSVTGDRDLSEELTQETFFQAVKNIDHFDGKSKISTWLCGIAKNVLLTYRRKNPIQDELSEEISSNFSPESNLIQSEDKLLIMRKLHMLDDNVREVMYLRLFGNLSFKEIGEILSKSENWARVTFYRGKEKLRKELENEQT